MDDNKRSVYISAGLSVSLICFYLVQAAFGALADMGGYIANPDSEALGNRVVSAVSVLTGIFVPICVAAGVLALILGVFTYRVLCKKSPDAAAAAVLTEALLYGTVFVSYGDLPNDYTDYGFGGLDLSFLNRAYLFIFGLISCLCIWYLKDKLSRLKEAFNRTGFRILWMIISFWISFSFVGKPLFMPYGREPWSITPLTVTVFLLFFMWIQPVMAAIVTGICSAGAGEKKDMSPAEEKNAAGDNATYENVSGVTATGDSTTEERVSEKTLAVDNATEETAAGEVSRRKVAREEAAQGGNVSKTDRSFKTAAIYFGIFFGSWILYLIACNPGNISQDAASAWSEIIGDRKISSLFPPLIKIFYRLITRAIPSIYVIAVTQILMMSLIAASFVMFLHRRGVASKKLIPGSLLFALFPPNGIFVVTFSSNFYYMVSMCLLTLCIIRFFAEEEETLHSRIYPVLLGLSLYGLYFMRNEGRYICIFFLILMAILSVKMKNLKWGMSSVGTVVVILLTNFVIFPAFGTGSGEMQSFDYWRNMLWSAAYYGGELPEQAESYYGNYEKFTEGDFSYDGCPPEKPEILSHDERMDAVSYVLEHDFPEVLRDRLNKSDVVWDVTEAVSAHNVREITMVVPTSYGFERHENILTKIFVKALYPVTIAVAPLDCLCYRSGIWIDAALLLILGFCVTRRKRCILTLLPALVHSAVFIFGLLWQCSRHVYVTELCVLMVLISAPFLMSGGKSRK